MEINLAAVMDELANRVRDSTDLEVPGDDAIMPRAYGWPVGAFAPPAFIVGYPPSITMDSTAQRGSDRCQLPCFAVFGAADTRASRDLMSSFLLDLKRVVDGQAEGVWQSARVMSINPEMVNYGGVDYLAARFTVDILT